MFRRVMVANRGEIASRVIKTLKRLSIESVAVFSEADKDAGYLKEATEAICIGPAAAKESYLCQEAILEAALLTDCEALHPGFGFLSENALFAERCGLQKLSFIGPSPKLISLMGDKARACQTMAQLSVPTLLGSDGVVADANAAQDIAQKLGFPVLLKARAGGGGKGMRLVKSASELALLFMEAQREALAAFGDGEIYVEKFVHNARHIEFQVLGDAYGNVVVLGERECSIQRKNQKLLEEAPAPGLSPKLRAEMSAVISQALKTIAYQNAGTMEFLLSDEGKLYFMEMNTRIQVEHPVTELITGLDIVEWQLRIACGERLPFKSQDLGFHGHAMECRLNAEDPSDGFKPSPGLIESLSFPKQSQSGPVRIDSHIAEGYRVTPFYDSMLAKVITHGQSRAEAIELMKKTLDAIDIGGISTTKAFLRSILENPDFLAGRYDCSFIEKFQKN